MGATRDHLLSRSRWVEGSGPHADVVVSSRVRIARNLAGVPFPHRLDGPGQKQVVEQVCKALAAPAVARQERLTLYRLAEWPPLDRQILVEKHLISPQLAGTDGYPALALNEDESASLMINEEDHLRLQVLLPALQVHESWRKASALDDALAGQLELAFNESCGFLTTCPTNVGTGLRASVMLHLPGLVLTGQARRVLAAMPQVGVVVRGMYGEGTEARGNLFQVSNQITLGRPEEEIINNLSVVALNLVEQERRARQALAEAEGELEDRVWRAYGLLTHARSISSQEALSLLSDIRLGMDMKMLPGIDTRVWNEMLVVIQPAYLQRSAGREMTSGQRDGLRAEEIRRRLVKKSGGEK